MSNLNATTTPSPDDSTEQDLVARIRESDLVAFERLFVRYSIRVLKFAVSMTGDEETGKDVMQDVFQWIWEHRTTWNPPADVLAYLLTATRHRALNSQRSTRRRDEAMARYANELHTTTSEDSAAPTDDLGRVADAIRALPERHRAILFLRWQQGLPWETIATTLAISMSAARTQHSRTIAALRRVVGALVSDE